MAPIEIHLEEVRPTLGGNYPDPATTNYPVAVPVEEQPALARSGSRLVIRTTGADGKHGVPFVACEGPVCDACKGLCAVIAGVVGYALIAAIIVFGAGGIARLTASTDLHDAGLGFVSWLLCFLLFCLCGGLWAALANCTSGDDEAAGVCGFGWIGLGILASILCIVLSHVGNRIDFMESAEPAMRGVNPLATGPGFTLGMQQSEFWVQDRVREFQFADSFIDLSLGNARTIDIDRSCGDQCSCACPKSLPISSSADSFYFC